jgi:hypothetical protein
VDALVGHLFFPVLQMPVFCGAAFENLPLQGVILNIADPALRVAVVPWSPHADGQQRKAVVPGKRLQFQVYKSWSLFV